MRSVEKGFFCVANDRKSDGVYVYVTVELVSGAGIASPISWNGNWDSGM